ncbi:hypothetical protein WAI453_013696 [Rhynchosporium graminicola]
MVRPEEDSVHLQAQRYACGGVFLSQELDAIMGIVPDMNEPGDKDDITDAIRRLSVVSLKS